VGGGRGGSDRHHAAPAPAPAHSCWLPLTTGTPPTVVPTIHPNTHTHTHTPQANCDSIAKCHAYLRHLSVDYWARVVEDACAHSRVPTHLVFKVRFSFRGGGDGRKRRMMTKSAPLPLAAGRAARAAVVGLFVPLPPDNTNSNSSGSSNNLRNAAVADAAAACSTRALPSNGGPGASSEGSPTAEDFPELPQDHSAAPVAAAAGGGGGGGGSRRVSDDPHTVAAVAAVEQCARRLLAACVDALNARPPAKRQAYPSGSRSSGGGGSGSGSGGSSSSDASFGVSLLGLGSHQVRVPSAECRRLEAVSRPNARMSRWCLPACVQ
jgi:hypothetical protein